MNDHDFFLINIGWAMENLSNLISYQYFFKSFWLNFTYDGIGNKVKIEFNFNHEMSLKIYNCYND